MEIKVLGPGCKKCKTLEKSVRVAVDELTIDANIEKVEDMLKIMTFGVMSTPALIIDGKVAFSGKSPSVGELKEILKAEMEN